jgi:hypothetical protein
MPSETQRTSSPKDSAETGESVDLATVFVEQNREAPTTASWRRAWLGRALPSLKALVCRRLAPLLPPAPGRRSRTALAPSRQHRCIVGRKPKSLEVVVASLHRRLRQRSGDRLEPRLVDDGAAADPGPAGSDNRAHTLFGADFARCPRAASQPRVSMMTRPPDCTMSIWRRISCSMAFWTYLNELMFFSSVRWPS